MAEPRRRQQTRHAEACRRGAVWLRLFTRWVRNCRPVAPLRQAPKPSPTESPLGFGIGRGSRADCGISRGPTVAAPADLNPPAPEWRSYQRIRRRLLPTSSWSVILLRAVNPAGLLPPAKIATNPAKLEAPVTASTQIPCRLDPNPIHSTAPPP